MPKYIVEVVRHRHFAVEVEAASLAAAIVAAQDDADDSADVSVMFDGDDELTEAMGVPETALREDLLEDPLLVEHRAIAGGRLCGVTAAYPVSEDLPAGKATLTIAGSGGEFDCDAATGQLTTPTARVPADYRNIVRVDVVEYAAWCAENKMTTAQTVDILFVGYWQGGDVLDKAATYEPPDADARAAWLRERRWV